MNGVGQWLEMPPLIELLKKLDVRGYTHIPDVRGSGDRGVRRADELSGESTNSVVLIACDDQVIIERLLKGVRSLISRNWGDLPAVRCAMAAPPGCAADEQFNTQR